MDSEGEDMTLDGIVGGGSALVFSRAETLTMRWNEEDGGYEPLAVQGRPKRGELLEIRRERIQ